MDTKPSTEKYYENFSPESQVTVEECAIDDDEIDDTAQVMALTDMVYAARCVV